MTDIPDLSRPDPSDPEPSDPGPTESATPPAADPTGPAGWPEPAWMTKARANATRVPGALPQGYSTTATPTSRNMAVFVDLGVVFPRPAGAGGPPEWTPEQKEPSDVGAGVSMRGRVVCTGEVRGVLHRWERRVEGGWIAIVSYKLPLAGDPRSGVFLDVAAVPEQAVRPVEESVGDGQVSGSR